MVKAGGDEIKFKKLEGTALDHEDEFFGETKIIKNILKITFKYETPNIETKIYYQGCSDKGFCYPIQEVKV